MSFKLLFHIALIAGFAPFLQATMPSDEFDEYPMLNPENPFDREVSEDFQDQDFDDADVEALIHTLGFRNFTQLVQILKFFSKLKEKEEPKSLTPVEHFQIWRPWAMIGITAILAYRLDAIYRIQRLIGR